MCQTRPGLLIWCQPYAAQPCNVGIAFIAQIGDKGSKAKERAWGRSEWEVPVWSECLAICMSSAFPNARQCLIEK